MEETQEGNLHPEIDLATLDRWDRYYLKLCDAVASQSVCLSRKIGAIIVKDKSVISTGYNGPPRGIPHCNQRHVYDKYFFEELKKRTPDYMERYIDNQGRLTVCPKVALGYELHSGTGLEWCPAAHAERNAIDNAARHGIPTNGSIMYMNCGIPCFECLKSIINAGIHILVLVRKSFYDDMSRYYLEHADICLREFGESGYMSWNPKVSHEDLQRHLR